MRCVWSENADCWFRRRRQDRASDLGESDQERLPRARLSPQLARRFREDRRRAGEVAGRHRRADATSCSPACRPPRRWTRWSTARTASFIPRGRDRSSSSSARIRCRTSRSTSRRSRRRARPIIDGEVSGTPGMVAARKAVIYLGGDAEACKKVEPVIKGFADMCLYLRAVRLGDQGQADQQPAGRHQHRRDRRGDGARAEGRRRRRPDDQGDRQRQRRLDPVRHPRAVDGGAQVPAGAGLAGAARSTTST